VTRYSPVATYQILEGTYYLYIQVTSVMMEVAGSYETFVPLNTST